MDGKQLRRLKPELDLFVERYLPWFGRSENQPHAVEFVHGLLGAAERRNIENIAQAVTGGVVRTLQKFISQGCWNAADVLAELQSHVAEVLGEAGATINVDETGFPKKGVKSVGVKRQYSGTLGRIDNCQVGVMANYCSSGGHTLIDRRLFLPEEWVTDSPRREEAGVPAGVIFRTKPELALEMVHSAVQAGMPFQWGGRQRVRRLAHLCARDSRAREVVCGGHLLGRPRVAHPAADETGRPRGEARRPTDHESQTADQADSRG